MLQTDSRTSSYENWYLEPESLSSHNNYTTPFPTDMSYLQIDTDKPMLNTGNVYPEPYGYSDWTASTEEASLYLLQSNMIDQTGYIYKPTCGNDMSLNYNTSSTMMSYPAASYDMSYSMQIPDVLPFGLDQYSQANFQYSSPYANIYCHNLEQWQQVGLSECSNMPDLMSSANSVTSCSPFSDNLSWLNSLNNSAESTFAEEEEPLQGLGLYDCPDLAADEYSSESSQDIFTGNVDPRRFSMGKGLKLEESFQFDDTEVDDED